MDNYNKLKHKYINLHGENEGLISLNDVSSVKKNQTEYYEFTLIILFRSGETEIYRYDNRYDRDTDYEKIIRALRMEIIN